MTSYLQYFPKHFCPSFSQQLCPSFPKSSTIVYCLCWQQEKTSGRRKLPLLLTELWNKSVAQIVVHCKDRCHLFLLLLLLGTLILINASCLRSCILNLLLSLVVAMIPAIMVLEFPCVRFFLVWLQLSSIFCHFGNAYIFDDFKNPFLTLYETIF